MRDLPQSDLVITCGQVRLVVPDDALSATLAETAARPGAVLPAGSEHFVTWLAGRPPEQVARERAERVAANRDLGARAGWDLDLAVLVGDEPVGMQTLTGSASWPADRTVGSASWLLAPFQGRGIGVRARAAVLELAFVHLGAAAAKSWALAANRASASVSAALGYRVVDRHEISEDGVRYAEHVYRLDRSSWLGSDVRRRSAPDVRGAERLAVALARTGPPADRMLLRTDLTKGDSMSDTNTPGTDDEHRVAEHDVQAHEHEQDGGEHETVEHGDHVDFVHDGHRHARHGDHYDEH